MDRYNEVVDYFKNVENLVYGQSEPRGQHLSSTVRRSPINELVESKVLSP